MEAQPSRAPGEEEATLASRFRAGDAEALGELYLRYFPSVYQTVGPGAKDHAVAEDLAQATFVRAWEQRARLRDPRKFRPWLLSMARHLAIDDLRRRQRQQSEEASDELASPQLGPEETALAADTSGLVWRAVRSLDPQHREVLRLAIREQCSTPEIGTALGISNPNAALRVFRAKQAMHLAVRTLLVATRAPRCPRLLQLVPPDLNELSARQRSTVDRHMRRCPECRAAADRLTEPRQLFGALALLALPQGWETSGPHVSALGVASGGAAPHGHAIHTTIAAVAASSAAVVAAGLLIYTHAQAPQPVRAPLPAAATASALQGRIFVTGDDPDVHARYGPNAVGAQHLIQAAVRFVTHDKSEPRLLLVTDVRNPGGSLHGDSRLGLRAAGYTFDVADYGSGTPGVLDLHTVRFAAYDAIIIASDFGGWLRQDELNVLDARASDLAAYVAGGGGLIAFAEGGAAAVPGTPSLTSHGLFGFLPATWRLTPVSESGAVVTTAGIDMGLTPADEAGNFLHAAFIPPSGATVVVRDGEGRAIAFWITG